MLSIYPRRHGSTTLQLTATDTYAAVTEIIRVKVEQKYAPENPEQLLVYPNPATDMLMYSIIINDNSASVSFRIIDSSGKTVIQKPVETLTEGKHFFNVDTGEWSSGIYFVQYIKNGKQVDVKRVVKY